MIVAAGLLVFVGLGLFVAGVMTGETVLYWLCVAVCIAAGVLLLLARRRMTTAAPSAAGTTDDRPAQPVPPADVAPPAAAAVAPAAAESPPTAETPATARAPEPPGAHEASGAVAPAATTGGSAAEPAHGQRGTAPVGDPVAGEPPLEEVEVTDLLLVVDLRDEVLVVDEHPRYHLPGCRWLTGRETVPLPIDEARTDGFTPCGMCEPDRHLADLERGRRSGRRTP